MKLSQLKRWPREWPGTRALSSVRGRIIAGIGLVVVVLVAIAAGSAWQVYEHRSTTAELQSRAEITFLLLDARASTESAAAAIQRYVIVGDEVIISGNDETLLRRIDESIATATEGLTEALLLEELRWDEDHVAVLTEVLAQGAALIQGTSQIIVLRQAGDLEAVAAAFEEVVLEFREFESGLNEIAKAERAQVSALRAEADQAGMRALWLLVVSGSLGAVLGLSAATFIARSILKPLSSLQSTAIAVTGGDLTARATTNGPRELAELGESLNSMTDSLLDASKRRELEEEREQAYAQLRMYSLLAENSNDFIAIASLDEKVQFVNKAGRELIGLGADEDVKSKTIAEFLTEEGLRASQDVEIPSVQAHGSWFGETTLRHFRTGRAIPVLVNSFLIKDPETGEPLALATVQRDITERKRAEEELRKLSTAVEQSPSIVVITNPEGNVEYVNPKFTQITGYTPDDVIGQNPRIWNSGETPQDEYKRLWEKITCGEVWGGEFHNRKKNGEFFWVSASVCAIRDEDGAIVHLLGVQEDITERKQVEESLEHLAYHDELTGLPNRTLFTDRLNVALAQARRSKQSTAVLFLDLDRFKVVNDSIGHSAGDQLLQSTAERLTSLVREGDTVARMGGDEFTVLLSDIVGVEDAIEVAERAVEACRVPWVLDGREFHVTTSIGIAIYPNDGEDAENLLQNADTAMYRAKEQGRDNYQLFTAAMNATLVERLALENDLRRGLEREEFVVHYQPQVDMRSGRIVGMEALVRWQHPDRGLVSPGDFIPVAEETGLILSLGEWVLRTACAQAKAWQEAGLPSMRIAVNLSARQFQSRDLTATVTRILEETGASPICLQLEVTESVAMSDVKLTARTLNDLQEMGIQIALDDFGTGHSSLDYLARFPIDALKIDRSFVSGLPMAESAIAITTAIINLAHGLNISAIAEGVETEQQLAWLKKQGCDEFQGHLFSQPLPAEAFEAVAGELSRLSIAGCRSDNVERCCG